LMCVCVCVCVCVCLAGNNISCDFRGFWVAKSLLAHYIIFVQKFPTIHQTSTHTG